MLHQFDENQAAAIASAFARMQRLDFRKLRRWIRELTVSGRSRTLGQLTEKYPIQGGVVELLAYLQIAHDDGHLIDSSLRESVTIEEPRHRHRRVPETIDLLAANDSLASEAADADQAHVNSHSLVVASAFGYLHPQSFR